MKCVNQVLFLFKSINFRVQQSLSSLQLLISLSQIDKMVTSQFFVHFDDWTKLISFRMVELKNNFQKNVFVLICASEYLSFTVSLSVLHFFVLSLCVSAFFSISKSSQNVWKESVYLAWHYNDLDYFLSRSYKEYVGEEKERERERDRER